MWTIKLILEMYVGDLIMCPQLSLPGHFAPKCFASVYLFQLKCTHLLIVHPRLYMYCWLISQQLTFDRNNMVWNNIFWFNFLSLCPSGSRSLRLCSIGIIVGPSVRPATLSHQSIIAIYRHAYYQCRLQLICVFASNIDFVAQIHHRIISANSVVVRE